jgi:pyruvate ferredoxin oxidoreductase alpha subunit
MVVSDGFFTSHQRQEVQLIKDKQVVQNFIGNRVDPFSTLNPRAPITVGPYMNDPDLINNKYQLHQAHEEAAIVFQEISKEFAQLTGREYPALESYQIEGAETALFLINSAAETAKDAVDALRAQGKKVGLIKPNILRPFPTQELKTATAHLKSIVIAERSDTPGSIGGLISHEVKSVLYSDHHCDITALSRVFGLGGKDFNEEDASYLLEEGLRSITSPADVPAFGFFGVERGEEKVLPKMVLPNLSREEMSQGLTQVTATEANGKTTLSVEVANAAMLATRPKRIAPGHGACPGCGIFSGLDQFFKGIEGDVVVLYHTGCAMVVTTDYPFSAHRVSYLHNLFQNGAPTLSGLVEVFHEKKRRGEINASEDITFVMVTGDGGMDIGMGPTIGTALRNHPMIILEYDNQGYMNTGGQLSYTTPFGNETSTSHVGKKSIGKSFHHKDTASIMAATGIPYVFTAIESRNLDLTKKAAKAQWYAKNKGLAFGKILITCPLNWGSEERMGQEILELAVDSCFFPVYEIEEGITTLTFDPEVENRKIPLDRWLSTMDKTIHLLKPENKKSLELFQSEVDRRWNRLKAKSAHPIL